MNLWWTWVDGQMLGVLSLCSWIASGVFFPFSQIMRENQRVSRRANERYVYVSYLYLWPRMNDNWLVSEPGKITEEADLSCLTGNHPLKEKLERKGNEVEQRQWLGVCSGWSVRTHGHIPFLSLPCADTHPSPIGWGERLLPTDWCLSVSTKFLCIVGVLLHGF